uniref:Immunoglobulin domain-containing protein n=1 Tax=Maylandia zebra TaxID=106582 RepID=A0A3P9DRV7_9CICH
PKMPILFSVLNKKNIGVHSITTVSKVSVEAGKPISIPCLYESQYIDHVKYLCEGHTWRSCRSFGSIDGTTVTAYMRDPNVFTVTMSGLQSEDSGWYLCAGGDIQIPVYLTVTEKNGNSRKGNSRRQRVRFTAGQRYTSACIREYCLYCCSPDAAVLIEGHHYYKPGPLPG